MPARQRPPPSPLRGLYRQLLSKIGSHVRRSFELTMPLVLFPSYTCPLQGLILCQTRQDAKDNRSAGIQLNPHQTMRDSVADVFKVHGRPFE